MANNGLEWKLNMPVDSPESLIVEPGLVERMNIQLQIQILKSYMNIVRFFEKAINIATSDPKKVIHGVKVGMALSLVSLFYYMRPLYDGVDGNAIWAVITVVVAFEYSVGATIAKSFNRISGTILAGSLGIGVHWIASQFGEELELVILQASVCILAAAATFSRFIPSVKARFDYGAMIFILTFSFVAVSGYRVDQVLELAKDRASTIAIGTSTCILTSMFFYPVWAGKELHDLIYKNLERLADSLDGCITNYIKDNEESLGKKQEAYKSVLNSKAAEETLANLAGWEPAHGHFKFRHPWKQYLKVGASIRRCAYCIETLSGFINSEVETPVLLKKHMEEVCTTLSSCSSNVFKELAVTMKTMTKSTKATVFVQELNLAVQSFQNVFKDLSKQAVLQPKHEEDEENSITCISKTHEVTIMAIFPIATMASLLIEIAQRIEDIAVEVDEMAEQAEFSHNDHMMTPFQGV